MSARMKSRSQSLPPDFLNDRPDRLVVALIIAAAIESAAVLGISVVQKQQTPPGQHGPPIRISIEAPPAPKVPPPPQPVPPPPEPVTLPPQPVVPPPPQPVPPPPPTPVTSPLPMPPPMSTKPEAVHRTIHHRTSKPLPQVVAQSRPDIPQQLPPQPPAPRPQMASGSEMSDFSAACRRAVQAALIYPDFARMNGQQGVVGIQFLYRDGVVSNVEVVRSSGQPALDAAAKSTVRGSQLPRPPKDLAGTTLTIDVNVVFHLS
jgi:protein TonB